MQQRQPADSPQKGHTQAQASSGWPHRGQVNQEESDPSAGREGGRA